MKCIWKTNKGIKDNSGETMVEVLVAFTLLTILLVIFSHGIAMATKSEFNADKSRNGADEAMKNAQDYMAEDDAGKPYDQVQGYFDDRIKRMSYSCTVDGQTYNYVYYEPILLSNGG